MPTVENISLKQWQKDEKQFVKKLLISLVENAFTVDIIDVHQLLIFIILMKVQKNLVYHKMV